MNGPMSAQVSTRRWGILVLATVLAMALSACGGAKEKPVSAELAGQLQQILDGAVESPRTDFPGTAVYVSRPDLGTWRGAAGEAVRATHTPFEGEDTFRAGSIMKPFVAVVILQLVEEGKLSLDDPLTELLPAGVSNRFAYADKVTVRMLLNHTSGIPEYTSEEFDRSVYSHPHHHWSVAELLDLAGAKPATNTPGTKFSYSNTNYNLLGLIIERATGEPWRAAVRKRIFDRLGLEHTSLPEPGRAGTHDVSAHGYHVIDGTLRDVTDIDTSMAGAAGGDALVTSTEDLTRFLRAVLAGELFEKQETVAAMEIFVPASDGSGLTGYGLGLEKYELPGGVELIGHVGSTAGYFAVMGHLPAQKVDVALVMTNSVYSPTVLIPVLKRLIAADA
jgi:D-alanyl-D-alanine carboxypeptidase